MSDTIDPNDLDSIDALLDEAELDVAEPKEEPKEEPIQEADEAPAPEPQTEEPEQKAVEEPPQPEPKVEEEPEPEPEPIRVPDDGEGKAKKTVEPEPEISPEEIIQKRELAKQSKAQNASNSNISVAEMESIKKLIIIFSSVLIVLLLTAIGIGLWGAIAASSKLDEETRTTLEDIKTGTTENTLTVHEVKKDIKGVHKKLDALSFQIEQLNADLLPLLEKLPAGSAVPTAINAPAMKAASSHALEEVAHDAHGKVDAHGHQAEAVKHETPEKHETPQKAIASAPVEQPTAQHGVTEVVAKMDPAVLKKLASVNSQMIKAQKRILEVNRRVKALQNQQQSLLKSLKQMEKTLLEAELKASKKKKQPEVPEDSEPAADYIYHEPKSYGLPGVSDYYR